MPFHTDAARKATPNSNGGQNGLRVTALQKRLGGLGVRPGAESPADAPVEGEDMLQDAIGMLEALQDTDPRVAQAIALLNEVASGPSESPEDTAEFQPRESPPKSRRRNDNAFDEEKE